MLNPKIIIAFLLLSLGSALYAAEWYVDNMHGNDANPGSKAQPFQTFKRSLEALGGGDTLHLVPNEQPYTEKFGDVKCSGTPEKPTVIDGHGAKMTRLSHFTADMWKDEGNSVFSLRFNNNVVTMSGIGYYCGFPFVFADGKELVPVKSMDDLEPYTCYMVLRYYPKLKMPDPLHKMLYIRLPEGKTPANTKIEAPLSDDIVVQGNYITVRNIVAEWSASDLFDSANGKGIVFEDIDASHCMDQCLSAHSTAEQQVRFSRLSKAVDGGVLDVTFNLQQTCHTRYFGCIFEDNIHFCGAGFQGGKGSDYLLDSCILRDNDGNALFARQSAKLTVKNCLIIKGHGQANDAVSASDAGEILLENCTIIGYPRALFAVHNENNSSKIKAVNCKFVDCGKIADANAEGIEVVPGDMTGSSLRPDMRLQDLKRFLQ